MPAVTVHLPRLHAAQAEIAGNLNRFNVLNLARRVGKSTLAASLCVETALEGGTAWWVVPSSGSPGFVEVWIGLKSRLHGVWISKNEITKNIRLPGGGVLALKSADRPDTLRGTGIDLVVLDEFAQYRQARVLWNEVIRPALAVERGGAIFPSTPKGRANFFYELHQRGEDKEWGEWSSWTYPSSANPFLDPMEIESARNELPVAAFEQEWLAIFNDAGTSPFAISDIDLMEHGWIGLVPRDETGTFTGPRPDGQFTTAWDIGRSGDATVGITLDTSKVPYQIVAYDRVTKTPFPVQQAMIEARARFFGDRPVIEKNFAGGLIENLSIPVVEFFTGQKSKWDIISSLQMLLERQAVKGGIPQLVKELKGYGWDDKGLVQDSVMALAIAAKHAPPVDRKPTGSDRTLEDWRAEYYDRYKPEMAGILTEEW